VHEVQSVREQRVKQRAAQRRRMTEGRQTLHMEIEKEKIVVSRIFKKMLKVMDMYTIKRR